MRRAILAATTLLLSMAPPARALWQPTDGPEGASVVSLAVDSATDDVYLATQQAVYRSTDGGATWTDIGTAPGIANVLSLHKAPGGALLVGVSHRGVWWSTNDGTTWGQDQITHNPHTGLGASISAVGIAANGAWLAGGYRSGNNGANWTSMSVSGFAFAVTATSATLAGTSDGVYRSTNGGGTWTPSNTGIAGDRISALAVGPSGVVYGAGAEVGVVRSVDHGLTWTSVAAGLPTLNVRDVAVDATGRAYAATVSEGVYASVDQGTTWNPTASPAPDPHTTSVATASNGSVYVGAGAGGVHESTDAGMSWEARNEGLHARSLSSLLFASTGTVIAGSFGNGTFRSVDDGASFAHAITGLDNRAVNDLLETASGDLLLGTWTGLYRSQDDGRSWAADGLSADRIVGLLRTPNGNLYALAQVITATPTYVFRSTDDGQSWDPVLTDANLTFPTDFTAIVSHGDIVIAGGRSLLEAIVVVSEDGGDTWVERPVGAFVPTLQGLAVGNGGALFALTQNGLSVSEDLGVTWTTLTTPWTGMATAVATEPGGRLFVGTSIEGVFRSEDGGTTWSADNAGLPSPLPAVASVSFDDVFAYVGTESDGLFRAPIDATVAVPVADARPVRVFPPRPNPFRAASTVAFELAIPGRVRVDVFAADGRRVRSLRDDVLAAGRHGITWDGRDDASRRVAPGTYWLRIGTPGETSTRAVTLVR